MSGGGFAPRMGHTVKLKVDSLIGKRKTPRVGCLSDDTHGHLTQKHREAFDRVPSAGAKSRKKNGKSGTKGRWHLVHGCVYVGLPLTTENSLGRI